MSHSNPLKPSRRDALRELTILSTLPFASAVIGCGSSGSGGAGGTADTASPLDVAEPPTDTAEPAEDVAEPPEDVAEPPIDTAAPPKDTAEPPDSGPDACATNLCIDLTDAKNAKLAAVGGTGLVTIGTDKVIVVHLAEDSYVALSDICTHKGCKVTFQKAPSNLLCPCHGSVFELDGSVTKGPATKPLKVYTTELLGTVLVVHKA